MRRSPRDSASAGNFWKTATRSPSSARPSVCGSSTWQTTLTTNIDLGRRWSHPAARLGRRQSAWAAAPARSLPPKRAPKLSAGRTESPRRLSWPPTPSPQTTTLSTSPGPRPPPNRSPRKQQSAGMRSGDAAPIAARPPSPCRPAPLWAARRNPATRWASTRTGSRAERKTRSPPRASSTPARRLRRPPPRTRPPRSRPHRMRSSRTSWRTPAPALTASAPLAPRLWTEIWSSTLSRAPARTLSSPTTAPQRWASWY